MPGRTREVVRICLGITKEILEIDAGKQTPTSGLILLHNYNHLNHSQNFSENRTPGLQAFAQRSCRYRFFNIQFASCALMDLCIIKNVTKMSRMSGHIMNSPYDPSPHRMIGLT